MSEARTARKSGIFELSSAKASAFEKMAIVRSTDSEKIRDFRAEQCESVSVRGDGDSAKHGQRENQGFSS